MMPSTFDFGFGTPRRLAAAASLFFSLVTATGGQERPNRSSPPDTRNDRDAYCQGIEQLRLRQHENAERSFRRAVEVARNESRTNGVVCQGMLRTPFHPEYQLQEMLYRLPGRQADVAKLLETITREGLAPREDLKRLGQRLQDIQNTQPPPPPEPVTPSPTDQLKTLRDKVDADLKAGRVDSARQAAQQALKINPIGGAELLERVNGTEFDAILAAAEPQIRSGDFQTAAATLNRARDLRVDSARGTRLENASRFINAIQAGAAARDSSRWDEARQHVRIAREIGIDANAVKGLDASIKEAEARSVLSLVDAAVAAERYVDASGLIVRARALGIADDRLAPIESRIRSGRFNQHIQEGEKYLASGQIAQARRSATDAATLGVVAGQAQDLLRRVDIRELEIDMEGLLRAPRLADVQRRLESVIGRLRAIDPANAMVARAKEATAAFTKDLDATARQRLGITRFYAGQYRSALEVLPGTAEPRATFYVALSTGALALLETDPKRRETLEQDARQTFGSMRNRLGDLKADLPFVSPALRRLLAIPD
jgi:tetratricopeptide (TPR) repeat protein